MDNNMEENVPAQGSRSPRSRRSGGIAPAPRSSSSNDGLPSACTAGAEGKYASAKTAMSEQEGGSRPPSRDGRQTKASRTPSVSLTRLRRDQEEFYSPCSGSLVSGGITSSPQDMEVTIDTPTTSKTGNEDHSLSDASTHASGMSVGTSTDRSTTLLDSDGESISTVRFGSKRKRGRPPKERNASRGTNTGGREDCEPSRGELKAQESVEEYLEEFRNAPTQDLGAIIIEEMARVWHVSRVSRGLKGELSGALKRASCRTKAAVQALLTQGGRGGTAPQAPQAVPPPPRREESSRDKEIAQLKLQLAETNRQLEELRRRTVAPSRTEGSPDNGPGRMEGAGSPLPSPPSPQLQPRKKRARRDPGTTRGRIRRIQSSSSEEEDPVGMGDSSASKLCTRPEDVLPPRNEWPPAMRPAVQGKRKDLDPLPQAAVNPQEEKGEGDMETRIMAKLAMMFENWASSQRTGVTKGGGGDKKRGQAAPTPSTKQKGPNKTPTGNKEKPSENGKGKSSKARQPEATKGSSEEPAVMKMESPVLWTEVVGRKAKRRDGKATGGNAKPDPLPKARYPNTGAKGGNKPGPPPKQQKGVKTPKTTTAGKKKGKRRSPRSAAMVITCPEGQYGDTMRLAREKINLADLGIEATRPKRALTGALILEIPGKDGDAKADRLADQMREVLAGKEGVKVSRPRKMRELRIRGLDDSVTKEEIIGAIGEACGCRAEEIQIGEITRSAGGLYSAWLKCPLERANRLVALGHLKIGWSKAKIDALEERPLQCYKCLERGHVRAQCPLEADRANLCYRCGLPGHLAKACTNQPSCIICREAGRKANHRLGGAACKAPPPKKKKEGKKGGPINKPTASAPKALKVVGPAPPPCALEGQKQPPRWEMVIPPISTQTTTMEVEQVEQIEEPPKERRLPMITSVEVVMPPRESTTKEGVGLEEPMDMTPANGD